MGRFLYGTSSWSEKSWVGPFYPEGMEPRAFLGHYATQFEVVEADVTYYRIPSRAMVDGWASRTPDAFELAAKFPRGIVHAGDGPRPDPDVLLHLDRVGEEATRFLDVMQRLGPKLGPLLLQFPYFNRTVFPSSGPFLDRLDRFLAFLPAGPRYAVEIRNRAWIGPTLLDMLRRHGVALALSEISYMPHPAELAGTMDLLTADFAYARLIGDRKAVEAKTKTFDRVVVDRSASLGRWAALLRDVTSRVPHTYAFANNHYAGHGPETIRELARLLQG